jgi:hypothetical protein
MSGTRQKEPGSTEGCQGAACHPGSPGSSLSSITAQKDVRNQTEGTREHRRMSGSCLSSLGALGALCHPITAQKDVRNQTEGTREHRRMSEGASELPILLYIRYTVCEISQFYSFCDFSPFYSSCEISLVFLPETSKKHLFCQETRKLFKKNKNFSVFSCKFQK